MAEYEWVASNWPACSTDESLEIKVQHTADGQWGLMGDGGKRFSMETYRTLQSLQQLESLDYTECKLERKEGKLYLQIIYYLYTPS